MRDGSPSLLRKLEVDRAVVYLVLARILQMMAFPVTLVLIARTLTSEVQGFYYAFGSIQALYGFVELGFVTVILNTASHEWSRLSIDGDGLIVGDQEALSRLVSLGRLVFKWYAVAAVIFVLGAGTFGFFFFSQHTSAVRWQTPLFSLIIVTAFLLWTSPFNALLEGSNQVVTINRLRLSQTVLENVALWIVLFLGGGLWAAVAASAAKLLRDIYLLFFQYRNFFAPFFRPPAAGRIAWKSEIWPMQWRLAVAGVLTYFASSLYVLVMFHYHGSIVAGRVGMTLQIVNGMQLIALAWVITKIPRFGMLIAQREYSQLDRVWLRSSLVSVGIAGGSAVAIWVLIYLLNSARLPFRDRILAPLPAGLFLLAAVIGQGVQCFVFYLRAHKQEPILLLNVVMCSLTGLLVWGLGSWFGPLGASIANVIQMTATLVWIVVIWQHYRTRWHEPLQPRYAIGAQS